jgi:hypothetical protein
MLDLDYAVTSVTQTFNLPFGQFQLAMVCRSLQN